MEIVRTNLANQVYEYIQEQIANGIWKPGQKIPSEIELAKKLNISRMTLRTGVQKTNLMGITETRVGEGTFVKEFSMRPFLETLYKSNLIDISDERINQMRETLQIGSVRIALNSEDIDSEIEELEDIYHQMEDAIGCGDLELFHKADAQFHRKICRLCHNEILFSVYDALEYLLNEVTKQNAEASLQFNDDNGKALLQYHRYELDAIKCRDIDRFIASINESRTQHERFRQMREKLENQ